MVSECKNCAGLGWVCENHLDRPWGDLGENAPNECSCGAGAPCKQCNPCDEFTPPRDPPGTVFDEALDKAVEAIRMSDQ